MDGEDKRTFLMCWSNSDHALRSWYIYVGGSGKEGPIEKLESMNVPVYVPATAARFNVPHSSRPTVG